MNVIVIILRQAIRMMHVQAQILAIMLQRKLSWIHALYSGGQGIIPSEDGGQPGSRSRPQSVQ